MSDWLPAATLGAGVIGTIGAQGLTGWLTWKREEGARAAERTIARNAFQRDTLLELQDALLALTQNTTKIHLHDRRAFDETGQFGQKPVPEEINLASGETMARVARLRQRVIDDGIREQVDALSRLCVEITLPGSGDQADQSAMADSHDAWLRLPKATKQLEERVGEVLRRLL